MLRPATRPICIAADATAGTGTPRVDTAASREAEKAGVRVALTRSAPVLDKRGGLLKQMLLPFKLGLGGPIAGGSVPRKLGWPSGKPSRFMAAADSPAVVRR